MSTDTRPDLAPVSYLPNFTDPIAPADDLFKIIDIDLDWTRIDGVPRSEFYCNDTPAPYTYGTGDFARTYEPKPWPDVLLAIRTLLEDLYECTFDVCFANRYDGPRDHLGWHSDDSPEMDPARPIVTVSFGATRDIRFARIGAPKASYETLTLTPGSIAVMHPGMQQEWRHMIPKSGHQCGPRISLTYRGYLPTC